MAHHHAHDCTATCTNCHTVCTKTLAYCISMGGKHVEPAHLKRLQDCADITLTCGDLCARSSELHDRLCALCAEACSLCAESCEKMSNDAQMKACAEVCRNCAEECGHMRT